MTQLQAPLGTEETAGFKHGRPRVDSQPGHKIAFRRSANVAMYVKMDTLTGAHGDFEEASEIHLTALLSLNTNS